MHARWKWCPQAVHIFGFSAQEHGCIHSKRAQLYVTRDVALAQAGKGHSWEDTTCHAAGEGKLHEETDLYCSPPSRLSRSPHSQKPMKQLHSRTMYQHHGLHFRLQEAAVYPHKAAQHEVLQSRTGRAICNTACKSLHALSTFISFTRPFSGLNLLAMRRISSCKAAWVGAGAEGLTHPKDSGWDQACQTAGRSSGREERERSAQTLRTLPAAPPPPLLARTT